MGDSPIDLADALFELDNNKDFLIELANDLLSHAKKRINIIREKIQNNEYEQVWRESHAIKGGALNIRANNIAGIASEIEQACRFGDPSKCNDLVNQLEMALKKLAEYITTLEK